MSGLALAADRHSNPGTLQPGISVQEKRTKPGATQIQRFRCPQGFKVAKVERQPTSGGQTIFLECEALAQCPEQNGHQLVSTASSSDVHHGAIYGFQLKCYYKNDSK